MHRRRVILMGTGTGVGKTYLGCQLLHAWRRSGVPTLALKPLESGYDALHAEGSDAAALTSAAGRGATPLYHWPDPLSPHLAARKHGHAIDPRVVVDWIWAKENEVFGVDSESGVTLIETAGGVFSPLGEGRTNADLALRLQPALVVIAAPDSLGVLHDVTATLRALSDTRPHLVVLSQARPPDASTGTNAAELENVVFPALGKRSPVDRTVLTVHAGEKADHVADRVLRHLDLI